MTTPTEHIQLMTVVLTDSQAEAAHLLGLLFDKYDGLLLTYGEAAKALGISVKTLERHVSNSAIRKVQIGGCVRIPITEIIKISQEGIR